MAIYTLLTEYVALTQPVLNMPVLLILLQVALQCIAPVAVIFASVKRRSGLERGTLSLLPMVFIITYAIMDALLGGSFLGGGFHHIQELEHFLHHPRLITEVGILLIITPLLSLLLSHGIKIQKIRFGILSALVNWSIYLLCLTGFLQISFGFPFPASFPLMDKLVLWYTYGIFAVLFQASLNITAVLWYLLFHERQEKVMDWDHLYNDRWCTKKLISLMMSGHRILLWGMTPLFILLSVLLYPEIKDSNFSWELLWLPLAFAAILVSLLLRLLFPQTVKGVRRICQWEDGVLLRRLCCEEFLSDTDALLTTDHMKLSENFLMISFGFVPILLYIPHIRYMTSYSTQKGFSALLTNGEQVHLPALSPKEYAILQKVLPWQDTFLSEEN